MKRGTLVSTPDGIGTVIRVSPFTGVTEVQIGCISAWYSQYEIWPANARKVAA